MFIAVYGCSLLPWLPRLLMVVHCCHGCLGCSCRSCPLVVAMVVHGCYGCHGCSWSFMPVRGCNGCLWLSRSFWSFMAIHGCSWLPWLFIAAMVAMDGPGHPIHPGRPAISSYFSPCAALVIPSYLSSSMDPYTIIQFGTIGYRRVRAHRLAYGLGPSAIAGIAFFK